MAKAILPEVSLEVKQIEICGIQFEVCRITPKCWTLTSLATGKTGQFRSKAALDQFVVELTWYIAHKQAMAAQKAA